MENRILVGTVAFLATLVLVGWIAINEGGRMSAFDRQFTARAIERGAALFVSQCSTCHSVDGRGSAQAPALNSPLLFGYDYLAEIHSEQNALNAERGLENTTPERVTEIDAQLAELETEKATAVAALQPAIDRGYDPDNFNRLTNLGWSGSLHNFVYTTLIHGRPTSENYWPQPMPAWSQTAGASLRNDQLEDIVQFVLNYDKGDNWTVEDLLAVNQFPKEPVDPSEVAILEQQIQQLQESGGELIPLVGSTTPIADIMAGLEGLTGDPVNGQQLYSGPALGCATCHVAAAGVTAPPMEGTWTRVETERLAEPQFEGYTGEQYLAESIIHADVYIVPPYAPVMPTYFGDRLNYQELADLIEFLKTTDSE
jgi:mono/diheme cytochrome c family protein